MHRANLQANFLVVKGKDNQVVLMVLPSINCPAGGAAAAACSGLQLPLFSSGEPTRGFSWPEEPRA
jgi:hypothetical protein